MINKEQILGKINKVRRTSFEPLNNLLCLLYETHIRTTANLDPNRYTLLLEDLKAGTSALLFTLITGIHPRQIYQRQYF